MNSYFYLTYRNKREDDARLGMWCLAQIGLIIWMIETHRLINDTFDYACCEGEYGSIELEARRIALMQEKK